MPEKSIPSTSDTSSPQVQERGSLRTAGYGQSQFIGSSSGVYFVNKVREAFADADVHLASVIHDTAHPSPEDCIVPDEDDSRVRSGDASRSQSVRPDLLSYGPGIPLDLGRPPPPDVARKLFMAYFQTWHRFFPFLHGPSVGKDIESLYTADSGEAQPLPLARVAILQCVFNLASLRGGTDIELPSACRMDKSANVLSCLFGFAAKGEIVSIQALFAAQLLLVARMSLRTAVVVAGLLSRAIFLAGLHRCPFRYKELTTEDCDIRKRLFWSIYVLDRFLSQSLGHPLGIQDSDVDVCMLNGPEHHSRPVAEQDHTDTATAGEAAATHHATVETASSRTSQRGRDDDCSLKNDRHQILAFQVEYARLSGRALELFHKSIHVRSINPSAVLNLRTDLDACWNSMPADLQDYLTPVGSTNSGSQVQSFSESSLFRLLYGQLRLLTYRPWLSLEPSTPDFQSALQICISVSRDTILNVKNQVQGGYSLFWPGYLSAAWLAGVILAFACHLGLYPESKGQKEISLCLEVLVDMSAHWPLARNCHMVLSKLLETIQQRNDSPGRTPHSRFPLEVFRQRDMTSDLHGPAQPRGAKRKRPSTDTRTNRPSVSQARNDSPLDESPSRNPHNSGGEFYNTNLRTVAVDSEGLSAGFGSVEALDGRVVPEPSFHQYGQQQGSHQQAPPGSGPPQFADPSVIQGVDMTGFPGADVGDGAEWAQFPGLGGWNNGMVDVLHGATWESLIHVVNQDHLDLNGQYL